MKSRLFCLYFSLFCFVSNAQLICPNFNMTDYNGQQWHLYDVLDEGRIVYVFLFSPINEAAWAYHSGEGLSDFYSQFGPIGDNTAMVFAMTGADINYLHGYEEGSMGNWVANIPYPTFYDGTTFDISFTDLFNLSQAQSSFSVFRICPDRSITRYATAPTAEQMAADMSLLHGRNASARC